MLLLLCLLFGAVLVPVAGSLVPFDLQSFFYHVQLLVEIVLVPPDDFLLLVHAHEAVLAQTIQHECHELLDGLDIGKLFQMVIKEHVLEEGHVGVVLVDSCSNRRGIECEQVCERFSEGQRLLW